ASWLKPVRLLHSPHL
ncbi:hypothetical protein D046_7188B, partial [Vibrio parahaemolyticus V-223/04]